MLYTKKTRIWISHLFFATKHLNMTQTIIFWKTGFWISGIPDPDFKSGPKMSGFSGFSGFFWSVWLTENMPPYLQSLKHQKLIISIFWRFHAIVQCNSKTPLNRFRHTYWRQVWLDKVYNKIYTYEIGLKFNHKDFDF